MKPYYENESVTIYHGDCREVLPNIDPIETCITDPPYGLEFMGKEWDHGVPNKYFWWPIFDVLLPGAICLSFGGTRTHHRLMVGIENAGFDIRDVLMWLYGSGFPKSLDIGLAIDRAAGVDREAVGKYKRIASPNKIYGVYGTGELNITVPATKAAKLWDGWGTTLKPAWEPIIVAQKPLDGTYVENALRHGVAGLNVEGGRIGTTGGFTNHTRKRSGPAKEGWNLESAGTQKDNGGRWPSNIAIDEEVAEQLGEQSRFFYCAKASRSDRGEGNEHVTVKPTKLMEWLCTLTATPTGGTVLDPFMGSGSTLVAASKVGRKAVGIEIEEQFCEMAVNRIIALSVA